MTANFEPWQKRAQLHQRTIYAAILIITLVTVAGVVGVLGPVRAMFRSRDRAHFDTRAQLITRDVAGFFDQAMQIAAQTPSRTRIREEFVTFLEGNRTLQSYREFTEPKLTDAVNASPEMLAIFRFDSSGRLIAVSNEAGVPSPDFSGTADGPTIVPTSFTVGGEPAFFVSAPIRHPGYGLVGFDIVALTMSRLAARLGNVSQTAAGTRVLLIVSRPNAESAQADAAPMIERVAIAAGAPAAELTDFSSTFAGRLPPDPAGSVRLGGSAFVYSLTSVADSWHVAVLTDEAELFGATRQSAVIIASIVAAVGLIMGVAARWTLRVVRDRSGEEARELAEVVDNQTQQLRELLGQRELLIREVHHRIKNDMGLVRSFLRLHIDETGSKEAKQILREADSKLAVMGEIYDRLYRSNDFSAVEIKPVLTRLLQDVASGGSSRKARVDTQIADIRVERSRATSLSIVINELVTNSLKYAEGDPLRIVVRLEESDSGALVLTVEDSGQGFPRAVIEGRFGFGLTMVRALVEQDDGRVELADGDPTRVRAVLPKEQE